MVAVFGTLLLEEEVMEVIRKAEIYGNQGWEKKYNYDFYDVLGRTAVSISRKGKKKSARKLLMFVQRLAEMYVETNWTSQYKKILEREYGTDYQLKKFYR